MLLKRLGGTIALWPETLPLSLFERVTAVTVKITLPFQEPRRA